MEFEVVSELKNFCFCVEVLDVCVCCAACDDSECGVMSVFTMLSDSSAFSLVILMCSPKLSFGSNIAPRILVFLTIGMSVLLILRFSEVLYSAGSGVKR